MDGDLFPIQHLKQRQCGDWPFIFGQITPKSAGNLFQRLFVRLPASGLAGHTGNLSKPDSYPSSWAQNDAFQPLHFLFLIKVRNRPFFSSRKTVVSPRWKRILPLMGKQVRPNSFFQVFPIVGSGSKNRFLIYMVKSAWTKQRVESPKSDSPALLFPFGSQRNCRVLLEHRPRRESGFTFPKAGPRVRVYISFWYPRLPSTLSNADL